MKKLLVALLVSLIGLSAHSQTVASANVLGYTKINLEPGGQYTLAACNFETGTTNTLLSIFGTDKLTQDDNPANCDRIFLYDSSTQSYQAWAQWTDGNFYKANDLAEWNQGIAGNPEVPIGTGFFISSGNISNTIILSGNVISVETKNIDLAEGFQIIGYTFSSAVDVQNTGFFDSGAAADDNPANCDRIHVWQGDSYQTYALWTDGVWYKANDLAQWNLGIAATNQISMGQAFFYEAQAPITWVETNAYFLAIQ